MYVGITVKNKKIVDVILFEKFPQWIQGFGTVKGRQEVIDAFSNQDNYVHIEDVPTDGEPTMLQLVLNKWRNIVQVRDNAQNVFITSSRVSATVTGFWEDKTRFAIVFGAEGSIVGQANMPKKYKIDAPIIQISSVP